MHRKFLFSFLLLIFIIDTIAGGQIINTIAGTGTGGYSGDGGQATNAQLGGMYYCYPAFDNAGNTYIAQNLSNTIRKIDKAGVITTIAGTNGVYGYTGDGGPAVNALLYHPTAIAIDNANNIFVSDRNGTVIRKISPSGIITTVSGQYTTSCGVGDGGLLVQAQFSAISALTIDHAGNLYISDYGCNTVRKVNSSGIITTIAGNGTWGYSGDGGPATAAQLAYPCSVAIDNAGNIYIADAENQRVRKLSTTGIITTIAGNGNLGYSGDGGPAIQASLSFPGSVVIDNSGNLYTGDYNNVVRKIDPSGIITTYAGTGISGYSGDGGTALLAQLNMTQGRISIDNNSNIYFADDYHFVVRKISSCLTATINQSPSDASLCGSGDTSFTISASNASGFQWQVNQGSGWSDLAGNGIYSGVATNSLQIRSANTTMNNYQYRCEVTNTCGSIFSLPATLTVTTPSAPSLTIATTTNSVCAGTSITFVATPQNAGTSPSYQWKKNGTSTGTNNAVYTNSNFSNGDIVTCVLTSSNKCITTNTAQGNAITITVNPVLTPSVSITPSANNICFGTPVSFTSAITNGGISPSIQWSKNRVSVGTNSPVYNDNSLNNGDVISNVLTSSNGCVTSLSVVSNQVMMSVTSLITPEITINASKTSICQNTTVTFTASINNGGSAPVYQWKKNGTNVGLNSSIYKDNNVLNADVISCLLTSNSNCLAVPSITSNSIIITVNANPVISLDHTTTLCSGSGRQLDAGNFSSYLWNDGSTGRSIIVNKSGTYYVTVTDNNGCVGSDTAQITALLPPPDSFLPPDTSICSYGSLDLKTSAPYKNYLWNTNATTSFITINQPATYWLEVTDNNDCKGRDSIIVSPKDCLKGFYLPTAFTPNGDSKNDLLKPLIFGNVKKYNFSVFNRSGQEVFHTTDINKGWDGTLSGIKQDTNVFVWYCSYQFQGEATETKKGTVILIR